MAFESLKKKYWTLRQELWEWNRYITFAVPGLTGRALRARWLKKNLGSCGAGPRIGPNCWIAEPKKCHFGNDVAMSKGIFVTSGGGVWLHDHVTVGPDSKIWSVNHKFEDPDTPVRQQGWEHKPVIIEEDVWLGACSIVKPGVTIGKGSILAAGTVLSKSVPPYSIVAGNPGRVVGWRKRPEAGKEEGRAAAEDKVEAV